MRNTPLITTALAVVSAAALAAQLHAQAQPAGAKASKKTDATIVGCVYREQDVPGRAPNVAERAGIQEDYILAAITTTPLQAGATGTAGQASGKPVGTSGQATPVFTSMYKLEFAKDTKLQTLVGRRVETVGRIDAEAGDVRGPTAATPTTTVDKIVGHDRVNLSEFEVASIKEVPGACPAKPTVQ